MTRLKKLNEKYCGCEAPKTKYADGGMVEEPTAEEVVDSEGSTALDSMGQLQMLMSQYGPKEPMYQGQLEEARKRSNAESQAFQDMLAKASNSQDNNLSKAEMYFRLASAFGAPTKTGTFGETLSAVGGELAEYSKGRQASQNQKLQLQLEGQKLKSGEAKEELQSLRTLSSEEMKDRRAVGQELIKQYVASGKPQSNAGKQAMDEGLKPNTPVYQARVRELADLDVQKQLATIQAAMGNLAIGQANLGIQGARLGLEADKASRLTGPELTMKSETEEAVAATDRMVKTLTQAYRLNKNTFGNSAPEILQRKALELSGSKNKKLLDTRVLENMISKQAVEGLKTSFGGNPTEGERKILLDLEGAAAKTVEERGEILKRAYSAAKARNERYNKKLKEISSGSYRMTEPGSE